MANIGQQLLNPEIGWKRIDDRDEKIRYKNETKLNETHLQWHNGTVSDINEGGYVRFRFYGTKLRLLGVMNSTQVLTAGVVNVDGVSYNISQYFANRVPLALYFQIESLPLKVHDVYIQVENSNGRVLSFDAIDLETEGYLVEIEDSRAILSVTMSNGNIKDYDLSISELNSFLSWFNLSTKAQSKYEFNKIINPYKTVKESLVFDKISSFEVREYEVTE